MDEKPRMRLQDWRRRRRWSQADMAREAGVSEWTVARIELGKPARGSTIRKLADALGIDGWQIIVAGDEDATTSGRAA